MGREFTAEERANAEHNYAELMRGVPDEECPTSLIGFYGPRVPVCICDGGRYEVRKNPFLINAACPVHGSES